MTYRLSATQFREYTEDIEATSQEEAEAIALGIVDGLDPSDFLSHDVEWDVWKPSVRRATSRG